MSGEEGQGWAWEKVKSFNCQMSKEGVWGGYAAKREVGVWADTNSVGSGHTGLFRVKH